MNKKWLSGGQGVIAKCATKMFQLKTAGNFTNLSAIFLVQINEKLY